MSQVDTTNLHTVFIFIRKVARHFIEDRCFRVADSLSYTTMLATVPLITVVFSVLSFFHLFDSWKNKIADVIFRNLLPMSGETVQGYLTEFVANAGQLTVIGVTFLFIVAFSLMATIEGAFNDIFRVDRSRRIAFRLATYLAFIVAGPVVLVASAILTIQIFDLPIFGYAMLSRVESLIFLALPFLLETIALALVYHFVPNIAVRWRHAIKGALVAAVLLEITKHVFAYSMQYFTSYQLIYGALAALPVFLLWIYLWWVTILLGAVITAELGVVDT